MAELQPSKPDSLPEERPAGQVPAVVGTPPRRKRRRSSPPPRARGCWSTCAFFTGASLLVLTVVLACMALVLTIGVADFLGDPAGNFLSIFGFDSDAEPEVVDSRTVVLNIQKLAVLETVRSGLVITKTVVDSGAAPDAELNVSYVGTVKAGVDLAQIGEDDLVASADDVLTVTLPPAQITHCSLGKPEVHSWDCRGWAGLQDCGGRFRRMQGEAYDRAIDDLLETATTLDLLGLATQNAQATLYDLLQKLGFEQIVFQTSAEVLPPDSSCLPD
ncbi:MAG: DUF4230 domain-containing protein [Anaerolineae bacterium]|nr:DUF4230 domain-containing protein [Anaerolineae bacterium]